MGYPAPISRTARWRGLRHGLSTADWRSVGLMSLVVAGLHAFDADHIAAIDRTTRKLLAEGKRERWNTHLSAPSEPS